MEKKGIKILVLTYWAYQEALVQTYTLPYLKIMAENKSLSIWLVCLQPKGKTIDAAELEAIQSALASFRIRLVLLDYKPLSLAGLVNTGLIVLKLLIFTIKYKIDVIHAWSTPAGALGYVIAKTLSRRLVIDSYEPHAEAMIENGTWKKGGVPFRFLFWLEKKQTHYASSVIAATEGMREYARLKYGKNFTTNFFVKAACVDFNKFNIKNRDKEFRQSLNLTNKIVAVYAGKFGGIYLDTDFFRWVKVAVEHWGDKFRLLLLTNHSKQEILIYCKQFDIPSDAIYQKFVSHEQVPRYMGLADFAVTPVKPVPSKRYCTPIKDGEYWAMGLPIIIPDGISDDSDIIRKEEIGYVFKRLNEEEYLYSIIAIEKLISDSEVEQRITRVAEKYRSFEIARSVYQRVYLADGTMCMRS